MHKAHPDVAICAAALDREPHDQFPGLTLNVYRESLD